MPEWLGIALIIGLIGVVMVLAHLILRGVALRIMKDVTGGKVLEYGEKCWCGGEIDLREPIQPEYTLTQAGVWSGKCFVCGEEYAVIMPI